MKRIFSIFLLLCLTLGLAYAKDPMGRGKSAFNPSKSYPQVDISGYEELEFDKLDQSGDPKYYESTAEYKALPSNVRVYDGFRHRLMLDIEGQINPKLYIRYKILQEPDLPQETDIYVEYDKFSIYFGKYDAKLKNGDLFSVNKNIDGLHADYTDENYQLEAIYGEERSHRKELEFSGTGKREYSLGQTNIVEGTVVVRLNGDVLGEDSYTIDYFDGTITFDHILSSYDNIAVHYEYLDPIEDFLPVSSKVRLAGIQHKYKMFNSPEAIISTKNSIYQYSYQEQALTESTWTQLLNSTHFAYENNNIVISIDNPEITKASLNYKGQQYSLLKKNNMFIIQVPENKKEKKLLLTYESDKFQYSKEFVLNFSDQIITKNIQVPMSSPASTASATMQRAVSLNVIPLASTFNISAGTTQSLTVTPSAPEQIISETSVTTFSYQTITENVTVVSVNFQTGYKISLPEGLVLFSDDHFIESNKFYVEFSPAIISINSVELQFKNSRLPLLFSNNTYNLSFTLNDDFDNGLNYCYLIITQPSKVISHKLAFFILPDKNRQRTIKKLELPNLPVQAFSEQLIVNDETLKEGKDYKINYNTGMVKFLNDNYPINSKVSVNYIYQESLQAQEVFKGAASKGPYQLANQYLVPGAVEISIDDRYLMEQDDFKVEYKEGRIIFNRAIKEVENVVVKYRYYVLANRNQITAKKENFNISSYFVQESAQAAEASVENSQSLTNSDLTVTYNGTITKVKIPIDYLPVVDGSETFYIDSNVTTNYVFHGYNGEFIITGNYSASSFQVDFNYAKSVYGPKKYFVGNNQKTIDLNLSRPMVYGSTILEKKSVGDSYYKPLVYLKDYIIGQSWHLTEGKADSDGLALVKDDNDSWQRGVITFITGNAKTGYFTVSNYGSSDSFALTYKISDVDRPDPGEIVNQTYGTKINYAPVENVNLGLEYDESVKRFQRTTSHGTTENIKGNGQPGQQVSLLLPGMTEIEVVEDSDQVFVNNRLKTKNDDYSINYKTGLVTFKPNIILRAQDIIRIEFDYYTTGIGELEDYMIKGQAIKVDSSVKIDKTNINLSYVTVNPNYDPVGDAPAVYTAGTEAKHIDISSTPVDRLNVYSKVEQLNTRASAFNDDQTEYRYRNSVIQQYRADYGFNKNDNLSFLANRTDVKLPDATSVNFTKYETDTTAYDYQANLDIGPEDFRTNFYLKNAESFTDVLDRESPSQIYNHNRTIKNYYKPLTDLSFNTYLANNIDDEFSVRRKNNQTKAYTEMIRYNPWTIDTSLEFAQSEYAKEESVSDADFYKMSRTLGLDKKQIYNFTFRRPSEWTDQLYEELYFHFDDTYSNLSSDLYNQKPNITRANNTNLTIRPYDIVSVGLENRFSRTFADNNTRDDYMNERVYRLTKAYPTKYFENINDDFFIINKIEVSTKRTTNKKDIKPTYGLYSDSNDEYDNILQNYSLNPLDNLSLDIDFGNKKAKKVTEEKTSAGLTKTYSSEPLNTYGTDLDYELENLLFAEKFHYTWARDFSSKKVHKDTYATDGSVTRTSDDLDQLKDNIGFSYYFDRFYNKHGLTRSEEFKQKNSEGARYSFGQTDDFAMTYKTPITGLDLTYGLNKLYNLQYKNPEYRTSRIYLTKNDYDEKLLKFDDTHRLTAAYTPWPILTFDCSYYTRMINQFMTTGRISSPDATTGKSEIGSTSYEFGTTYRPFEDFSARYGWRRDIYDAGLGEQSKFTVEYVPAKFDLGTVNLYYENIFTYGKGTNDPAQEANANNLLGFIETVVEDRQDVKVKTTLTIKINKDIANVIVDDMQADVNLTRLHFWDQIHEEYSYSVNAFYAKVTLRF